MSVSEYTQILIDNLNLILDNLDVPDDNKEIGLRVFPRLSSKDKKDTFSSEDVIKETGISYVKDDIYKIEKNGKFYYFKEISHDMMEEQDIETIRNHSFNLTRLTAKVLEIVCSHHLSDTYFVFAITDGEFKLLVDFYKNNKRYILDYESDIIMEKDDYYELKNVKEVCRRDSFQVFLAGRVCSESKYEIMPIFLMFFYEEVMPKFIEMLGIQENGYDEFGINYRNYQFFYSGCDATFRDPYGSPPIPEFVELNDLTVEPIELKKGEDHNYHYKDYVFDLLSDYFITSDLKERLLKGNRYGVCFVDNINLLNTIYNYNKGKNVDLEYKLVAGFSYYGRRNPYYHAWGEIKKDGEYLVVDFTQNIVMPKEDFYRYSGAIAVSEISLEDYLEMNKILREMEIGFNYRVKAFLGNEILSDIKRLAKTLQE